MNGNQANRGMGLETLIKSANEQYQTRGEAVVQKVETPTVPIRDRGKIVRVARRKSTVDFIGAVEPGIPVAFDAKETAVDLWPLSKIETHQLDFLVNWAQLGGIAFLLVEFTRRGKVFYLPALTLHDKYYVRAMSGGRKSIAFHEFEEDGIEVPIGRNGVLIDYVPIVKQEHKRRRAA